MPKGNRSKRYSYDVKVGACADYLIGIKGEVIQSKWGVSIYTVTKWIRARKCFKIRRDALQYKII